MAFVKVVKNKAYFKRFQTQFRRRREGKTDYTARRAMIIQDKNKYNSPKYRFVARITNKDVICQVAFARILGDEILAAAYAHELPRYGVKVGLTNYSAAYCTGLLLARRVLKKLNLDTTYEGEKNPNGEHFLVEENEERRPFKCVLDVGLRRTTTGARVFATLKGACDGGLYIPHGDRRFPGYNAAEKKLDAAVLRKYIFGGHVADYMRSLEEEDPDHFQAHFARFIKNGIKADDLEKIYKKAHEQIRKDPTAKLTTKKPVNKAFANKPKHTIQQKRARVNRILAERKSA